MTLCKIVYSLAGSERYEDSKAHSKQLMEESKENNKSLLALKECVRARAKAATEDGFAHIPYRTSKLTWLLKVSKPNKNNAFFPIIPCSTFGIANI